MVKKLEVRELLLHQLSNLYLLDDADTADVDASMDRALERCEFCFSHVRNKYYQAGFDPLHSCQWAAFLYYLSNSIYRAGGSDTCDKIYGLLRALSAADLFYQVELPNVFTFDHPLGSVIGRGSFQDYFSFSQGCTVGNNHGVYPTFGRSVFMLSNSKVIGNSHIGDHVIIGANTYVKDADIPNGSFVFGQSPNLVVKEGRMDTVMAYAESVFRYE